MAKKVLTSSESGADSLSDINANYTELYTGQEIVQATDKATPVDADLVGLIDSVSGLLVKLTWANLKATLKTYFDSVTTTLTNKTLTSPKVETAITDTNGNEIIKTPATASAVNEITITNAATGNAPLVEATGGDTNIDLKLKAKGTGLVKLRILQKDLNGTLTREDNVVIVGGWGYAVGNGTTTIPAFALNFGITFSSVPDVTFQISSLGRNTSAIPTSISDTSSNAIIIWHARAMTATGVTITGFGVDGTYAASDRNVYSWLVMGILN